jgi:hypothetical protein
MAGVVQGWPGAHGAHQTHTQDVGVELHGGFHIVRDQSDVINASTLEHILVSLYDTIVSAMAMTAYAIPPPRTDGLTVP